MFLILTIYIAVGVAFYIDANQNRVILPYKLKLLVIVWPSYYLEHFVINTIVAWLKRE